MVEKFIIKKPLKGFLFFLVKDQSTRFIAKKIDLWDVLTIVIWIANRYIVRKGYIMYKLIFTHPKTSTWGCVSVSEKKLHFSV